VLALALLMVLPWLLLVLVLLLLPLLLLLLLLPLLLLPSLLLLLLLASPVRWRACKSCGVVLPLLLLQSCHAAPGCCPPRRRVHWPQLALLLLQWLLPLQLLLLPLLLLPLPPRLPPRPPPRLPPRLRCAPMPAWLCAAAACRWIVARTHALPPLPAAGCSHWRCERRTRSCPQGGRARPSPPLDPRGRCARGPCAPRQ
jgi:hypothetical protein